ncbi:IS5/IS1182 family transposase [Olsenella sp. oral taxon 807]|uniref:IS5/IS1182 family transposase n=1 Tax=Olsenella sp. oral taxon 807 TaxID=712411 RepID=UPI00067A7BF6|nr:IS5/IS1182 family transposase [Olsenella sp. oral taxon 807]
MLALVEPPGTGAGRQPWPAETLPGTRLARCRPDLSDVACEDACYDSPSVRDLVGCWDGVPDATTIEAPSPPENASGSRDPEMHQTKKGNQWHFGMKCHSGEDAGSGYVHSATLAAANVPDVCEAHGLVRDDDEFCYADAGYRGVARREEVRSDPHLSGIDWRVAMGPSRPGAARRARWDGRGEGRSRGLRAREGKRPCQIARRAFGYARVRYRGIAKRASAHPRPARQRQPARVRQGREAGGVPGGLRGGRLTAAEGTGVPRGRPEGPGTPGEAAGVRI